MRADGSKMCLFDRVNIQKCAPYGRPVKAADWMLLNRSSVSRDANGEGSVWFTGLVNFIRYIFSLLRAGSWSVDLKSVGGAAGSVIDTPSICNISTVQRSIISAQYLFFHLITSTTWSVESASHSFAKLCLMRESTLLDVFAINMHSGLNTVGIYTLRGLSWGSGLSELVVRVTKSLSCYWWSPKRDLFIGMVF